MSTVIPIPDSVLAHIEVWDMKTYAVGYVTVYFDQPSELNINIRRSVALGDWKTCYHSVLAVVPLQIVRKMYSDPKKVYWRLVPPEHHTEDKDELIKLDLGRSYKCIPGDVASMQTNSGNFHLQVHYCGNINNINSYYDPKLLLVQEQIDWHFERCLVLSIGPSFNEKDTVASYTKYGTLCSFRCTTMLERRFFKMGHSSPQIHCRLVADIWHNPKKHEWERKYLVMIGKSVVIWYENWLKYHEFIVLMIGSRVYAKKA